MDELQDALARLNARREIALAQKAENDLLAAKQKQAAWEKIKTDAHLASFLTEITKSFGKPKKMKVAMMGEVIIDTWNERA